MVSQEENHQELKPVEMAAAVIRENSKEARLTHLDSFLEEPHSFDAQVVEALPEELAREEYADIKEIKGAQTRYYYDSQDITDNYARMLAMVEDKDLLKLVAETVRHESKTYPRPTTIKLFTLAPFHLDHKTIEGLIKELAKRQEYEDIQEVKASNGAIYLYSDRLMKKAQAASIAEWTEVLRFENP